MNKSGWLSPAGLSAIATALFAFIAFFKDTLLRHWNRPKLRAELQRYPPDTSLISDLVGSPVPYFRIKVWNKGKTAADKAEVYAKKMQIKEGKVFQDHINFLPMNLTWSHLPDDENIYMLTIPPKTFKHCDLGHIYKPDFSVGSLCWKAVVSTNILWRNSPGLDDKSRYFILNKRKRADDYENYLPNGEYLLTIVLAAANAKPREIAIRIVHNGILFDELERFLAEGSFAEITKA